MRRKILFAVLVAAAVVVGLWRLGVLDERKLKDEATEVRERAAEEAKDAAKAAREAVESKRR